MACRKPVRIATVPRNAWFATAAGRLATTEASASVCVRIPAYLSLQCIYRFCANLSCDFAANVCKCDNGVAQVAAGCIATGASKCLSCNTGWTINRDGTECIRTCQFFSARTHPQPILCLCLHWHFLVNACTCDNGVGQTGAGCAVNGAAKCAACNPGWTANHDNTKCIRECQD